MSESTHQRTMLLGDASALRAQAETLAHLVIRSEIKKMAIFLSGELGVGKTTFAQGFLKGMGVQGNVKSPTYTLVEPYQIEELSLYHMDWYRLREEAALVQMGMTEYFQEEAIILLEWPITDCAWLPVPDLGITISIHPSGRSLSVKANTQQGKALMHAMG